jgi:hypothetical protein
VALQETLGEAFAGFKHGSLARGTENANAALLKRINNAEGEREFRANDDQGGLLGLRQAHHLVKVLEVDGDAARHLRNASITRRAYHLRYTFAAGYSPGKRMFSSTRTKDQNLHESRLSTLKSKTKIHRRQWDRVKSNGK